MRAFRQPNGIIRSLNILVLSFFTFTFYAPSALAMKEGIEQQKLNATLPENQSEISQYSKKLQKMKGHFLEAERLYKEQENNSFAIFTDIKNAIETGESLFRKKDDWEKELKQALVLLPDVKKLHKVANKDFAEVEQWIKDKQLPGLFMERHNQTVDDYQTRYDEFAELADKVASTQNEAKKIKALEELNKELKQHRFGRSHQEFDKEQLGNFTPKSAKGQPLKLTSTDYIDAGLYSNPVVQIAQLGSGNFDFSNLPQADDPAYLAETDEIKLTQPILDKAQELEYKPVEIYNWIRNNIEYIPGWGSYQSAQLTLEAGRGNAMDIASLHIALLRASGIPARYVQGVIEIPADKYTNWLGNFKNADVASDYASSNGIATQLVLAGGKITKIRTEHIWVEAAVDFSPSQGAKNRSADAWIAMDASFKQYEYEDGLDAIQITGIDAEALANQFTNSGTVDEDAGFVQNLDPTALLDAQEQAQTQLRQYIENNLDQSTTTIGDVIGARSIIAKDYEILADGLPYRKINQGATYGQLPSQLQNRMAIGFGSDRTTYPVAVLNNQKITLSFRPATKQDSTALGNFLPEGDDLSDISKLPNSIPSYLINVIPQLALNGEIIKTGSAMKLGEEIDLTYQQSSPTQSYAPYSYSVIAGSYLNVPVVAQNISPVNLEKLQNQIEQTRTVFENADDSQIETLTRDKVIGDLFYAGSLGYFAQYDGRSHVLALRSKGAHRMDIGYGSYGYEPNQDTFFGITRAIKTGGAVFNTRIGRVVQSFDANKDARNLLRFQSGMISSTLEHEVPEQMFSKPDDPTDAVSALKALQLAAQQGQNIYQISASNQSQMANLNLSSEVEAEMQDAINQGRLVVTHTSNIQVPGWSGAGYLILDPEIMDGSYKISGGLNGGSIDGGDGSEDDPASPIAGVLGALLSILIPPAEASEGDASETAGKAFEVFKTIVVELYDAITDGVFKVIGTSFVVLEYLYNAFKVISECESFEGLAIALTTFTSLSILGSLFISSLSLAVWPLFLVAVAVALIVGLATALVVEERC